jgi:hypothetical protein
MWAEPQLLHSRADVAHSSGHRVLVAANQFTRAPLGVVHPWQT